MKNMKKTITLFISFLTPLFTLIAPQSYVRTDRTGDDAARTTLRECESKLFEQLKTKISPDNFQEDGELVAMAHDKS